MEEDVKREFDAVQVLHGQYWAEYQEKTRLEWKFSFGMWSLLLTLIGIVGSGKLDQRVLTKSMLLLPIGLAIIGIHFYFLSWIQKRLKKYRIETNFFRDQLLIMAKLKLDTESTDDRIWWKQHTLWLQLSITLIFFLVLCLLLYENYTSPTQ